MTPKTLVPLTELKKNQEAVVAAILTCHKEAKRLADLGLTPNTPITVVRKNFSRGPIEIKIRGSNLILGKGIASKILVYK